jgi:PDDEXK-like uncharacterized protein DUF3799
MRNRQDNRLHFSELKRFALSPAHFRYACEHPKTLTREMTVGAVFDALVLGGRKVALYPGKVRNGKEWDAFRTEFSGCDICIQSEYDEAKDMADAVLSDPIARALLADGEHQRVMQWDWCDVPCGAGIPGKRGGFDVLGADFIADLKATSTAQPEAWMRHAWRMHYPAQLGFYRTGAESIGHKIKRGFLIGVESSPPHCVTVLELDAEALDDGEKMCRMWIERYKGCEAANVWPGYVQSVARYEKPEWMNDD